MIESRVLRGEKVQGYLVARPHHEVRVGGRQQMGVKGGERGTQRWQAASGLKTEGGATSRGTQAAPELEKAREGFSPEPP